MKGLFERGGQAATNQQIGRPRALARALTGMGLALVAAAGCSRPGTPGAGASADALTTIRGALSATTQRVTVALQSGTGFDTVGVAATDTLLISDRARVQFASTTLAPIANSGATQTQLGYDTKVGTVTSSAAVTLLDRVQVAGDVVSAGAVHLGNSDVISGAVRQNAAVSFDRFSWSVSLPASGAVVTVPVNGSRSIAAGSYAAVTVYSGATLSLAAGTYFMDSLDIEPQARLAVDTRAGNVLVYVRSGLTYRGSTVYTGPNNRLLLAYLGTASPAFDKSPDATVVAPSSSVRLGVGGSPYSGAIYARAVQLDPDVKFTLRTYAGWNAFSFDVEPRFECVSQRPGGSAFVGLFGYRNPKTSAVTIPVGANNQFTPGVADRKQPTVFAPGTHDNLFAVTWVTHPANWTLNGMVAAIDTTKVCPANTSFAAAADTTVKASDVHAAFGANATLEVGAGEYALVSFDRTAIANFLGPNQSIASASLVLTLPAVTPSGPIEAIAMRNGWTEAGATWSCANDTDPAPATETCARADKWKMQRRDGTWDNPWERQSPTPTPNLGTVQGTTLVFDVTADAQAFFGVDRFTNTPSWVIQAPGAAALVAQLSAHEAGAAVAPQLVITPFTFTDYDASDDNDDQDAPLSFAVDTTIVPQNPPLPSPTPGGPDRPLVAMVAADGTEIDFTDSELVVLTNSAAELSAIQSRLGATVVFQSPFATPDLGQVTLLHIDPTRADPTALVPALLARIPGMRGRNRLSSDNALRLLAAASDESGRGSRVFLDFSLASADVTVSSLAARSVFDGGPGDTLASTFSSSDNDFDWAYFGTDMHDVPRAWKLFLGSGRFLEPRIKVTVLDGGFRLDKLDGLEGVTLAQPPCPEPNCPNPSPCQGGFSCPWHGTNTVNSGFAEPGNFLGGGGPGWPALNGDGKDLTLAWSAADPLSYSVNGVADLFRGTDLLSMSFGEDIPAGVCATGVCTALELMTKTISADGTLQLAAAGNGGFDDDRLQCFSVKIPLSDVASGIFGGSGKPARIKSCPFESTFTWPCESWGVDCVDGSLFTSHDRDPKSNFGSKKGTIAYRASFTTLDAGIDTANDNNFYVQQSMGTSESTPLVAGIAKLIWTAVPAMSVGDVEACLSAAGEFVVASSALRCALGSPANFPPAVQINFPGDQTQIDAPPLGGVPDIVLNAAADDFEDGPIGTITWVVNGTVVGTSASNSDLTYTPPAPGMYTIVAQAQDSTGAVGSATVHVSVSPSPPGLTILKPEHPNGAHFQAISGLPVDLSASVWNRINFCSNVTWSAIMGTTPVFTNVAGCAQQQTFTAPSPPAQVTLTANYSDAGGSASQSVTIDVVDDGLAHVKIMSPAIGPDGLRHIQAGKPTTLAASSVRVPAGPTFTWTTQIGTQDIVIVGGPTATTTATFSLGNAHCTATGTLNVMTADASGGPVHDSVPFELDGDCQPH
ncbi:MAG TPA: S8 family serine peptidase [Polyangia bacterium]|nr:S8 family serine peptidase [Polyangia bacterium]